MSVNALLEDETITQASAPTVPNNNARLQIGMMVTKILCAKRE